jgi:hypothetical protein
LQPGESALAVFTDGRHFQLYPDGTGTSGNWKTRPPHTIDRFVVYCRDGSAGDVAQVYCADFIGTTPSPEAGRVVVQFRNARQLGITRQSWPKFADTGTNPVRCLSAAEK